MPSEEPSSDLTGAWADLVPSPAPVLPDPFPLFNAVPLAVGEMRFCSHSGQTILRLTADGQIGVNPNLTPDEAVTAFLACLQDRWAELVETDRIVRRYGQAMLTMERLCSNDTMIEYHDAIYASREPRETFERHAKNLARLRPETP